MALAAVATMMAFISMSFTTPSCCYAFSFQYPPSGLASPNNCHSNTMSKYRRQPTSSMLYMSSSNNNNVYSAITQQSSSFDRTTAQQMVDQTLCPSNEERERNIAGMEAYQTPTTSKGTISYNSGAISNDDPRSEYTYGEFPFESFDLLVDRALDFVRENDNDSDSQQPKTIVDLGSGCGRLVFYASLTRGRSWNIHGVEIGTQLHSLAVNSLQRGVDKGWFEPIQIDCSSNDSKQIIAFHNGNALLVEDPCYKSNKSDDDDAQSTTAIIQSVLSKTNILFAYSTVWETDSSQPFNQDIAAMILSPKWSSTLANLCRNGCVAITTDRALNPEDGWKLVDRMDVANPSVWGSVGYISVLEK